MVSGTKKLVTVNTEPRVAAPGLVATPPITVISEKPGQVTALDRMRAYYHTLISAVGTVLIVLNQALPVVPDSWKSLTAAVIATVTVVSTALKSNETWINAL